MSGKSLFSKRYFDVVSQPVLGSRTLFLLKFLAVRTDVWVTLQMQWCDCSELDEKISLLLKQNALIHQFGSKNLRIV